MKVKRTTISLPTALLHKAHEIMKIRDFQEFSGFIAQLIREEHERRGGTVRVEVPETPKKGK